MKAAFILRPAVARPTEPNPGQVKEGHFLVATMIVAGNEEELTRALTPILARTKKDTRVTVGIADIDLHVLEGTME